MAAVLDTKLHPPRGTGRLIEREAMRAKLLAARRVRCVVLTGPAGAGKSTTLAAWRRDLLPLGFEVSWLSLSADDRELSRFLDGLVASIALVDPAITRGAALLGDSTIDADGVERLIITLVRGIAEHGRDLVLVLDDLHHLHETPACDALQWLLDYAPTNLHLALASRNAVPLSLERLRAQRQILELDLRDLRFTPAESERFLQLQLGDIEARDARQVHELTDGWVAGLQLLSIEWKKRLRRRAGGATTAAGLLEDTLRAPLRDARAFGEFFEREVFDQLAPHEVDALVRMACCSRFCASLCAALAGREDRLGESAALLVRLEADNLFIVALRTSEVRSAESWYRLHPLLRETLLQRFAAYDRDWQREMHARAWRWFRGRGLLEEAICHAVPADEAGEAADLVERCAQGLFVRGERRSLISLVRQLPPAQVRERIGLRLWTMRSHLYLRELDACQQAIEDISRDVPASDAQMRFLLAVHAGSLAVQRDDTEGALALLPQISAPPPHADVVALGGSVNIRSWLHMHRGDYETARQVQQEAATLMADGAPLTCTAGGSLYGRALVGLSHTLEGQMTQAERIYRSVLHEAEPLGRACADTALFAAALLGDVLYESNEWQVARELLASRVDMLERLSIPDAVLRALRVLSAAHWLAGQRLESFAWLERLEDYAVQHGLDRLLAHSLAQQIRRRLALGEYLAAESLMARLDALDAKYPDAGRSALREIGELAQRMRIRWRVVQGDLDSAAALLTAFMAQCEANGRQRGIARLRLEAARIEALRGNGAAARALTLSALRLGHKLGLLRSLLDADDQALELIRAATRDGEEELDPVLSFYIERLESAAASGAATPMSPVPSRLAPAKTANLLENFSGREIDMLRLLAQAMPNKKIARTLGLSPETVKWYLSRIYAKLRVAGRDEAVARVRDLGWGPELGGGSAAA